MESGEIIQMDGNKTTILNLKVCYFAVVFISCQAQSSCAASFTIQHMTCSSLLRIKIAIADILCAWLQ